MAVKVSVNQAAVAAYVRSTSVMEMLQRLGDDVAADAATAAPKRTGAGAASIRAEIYDGPEPEVRVSWERTYFYMYFAEVGTSHESARPFLRPALLKHRTVA